MKYTIQVNQTILSQYNFLDIKDAGILDYLRAWCQADDKKVRQLSIKEEGIEYRYTWINFRHLIQEMPLLRIKSKSAISKRITKLEKTGFIKTFRAPDRNLYIRLTAKIKELEFKQGVYLDEQGVRTDEQGVFAQKNTNNISIKQNTNNTSYKKVEKSSLINNSDRTVTPITKDIAVANATATDISKIINFFKEVSPLTYKDWFGNKTERKASAELLNRLPMDKLEVLITKILPRLNVMPYVPKNCKAFKPSELLRNLDRIIVKVRELQQKRSQEKINIEI